jgi:co-chaperonin GroES (HSP10)
MREKVLLVIFLAAATAFANAQDWVPLSAKPYVAPGTAADCTAWTDSVSSVPAGTYGRVIAVGAGLYDGDELIPMSVQENDVVLFAKWAPSANEIKLDGHDYVLIKETDILGIIK